MSRRRLALLPIARLLLAACAGESGGRSPSTPPASAATRIEVKLTDALRMEPAAMTVPAGVPVTFVVTNGVEMLAGGMAHGDPDGRASWCPPCQQETPDIRAVYEANRDAGLVVLAIDVQEPADTIREYAQRYALTYTIGVDTYAAIMKTYGVFGLPTHYFIDRRGVIRDRYFGPLKRDQMDQRVSLISQP